MRKSLFIILVFALGFFAGYMWVSIQQESVVERGFTWGAERVTAPKDNRLLFLEQAVPGVNRLAELEKKVFDTPVRPRRIPNRSYILCDPGSFDNSTFWQEQRAFQEYFDAIRPSGLSTPNYWNDYSPQPQSRHSRK